MMKIMLSWIVFIVAAVIEVTGDALIRKGLRKPGLVLIAAGFVTLGCYGLIVNLVKWDFSKLLGVYVAVFAVVSVIFSRAIFKESISPATWIGVAVIAVGGLIVQYGAR